MYRRLLQARYLWVLLGSTVTAFLLQSCDERYDLENISGDVQIFENGISAPVGETTKFYLTDFIEEGDMISVVDGRYALKYSGAAESVSVDLPEVHVDAINPNLNVIHIDFMESIHDELPEIEELLAQLGYTGGPLPQIPIEAPDAHATIAESTENFEILVEDVPEEVVNIKSMHPATETIITMSFHAEGFPTTISYVTLDLIMENPKQLDILPVEEDIWRDADGYYHIYHKLPCVNGTLDDAVHFEVESIHFEPALERRPDGTVVIESEMYYKGVIHIDEPFDLSGWTPAFDLKLGYMMDATSIDRMEGCIKADIDPIELEESITGLPDFLSDPGNTLDLQSVGVSLGINNKTPLALDADLELQSTYVDGGKSPLIVTETPIHIDANKDQTLLLTNDAQYAGNVGYIHNLNELVTKVPSSIYMKALAQVPPTDVVVELGGTYSVDVNYELLLPIVFGDKVNLTLETEITGLGGNEDILAAADNALLYADVVNTLPLDLALEATALDANGKELNYIKILGVTPIKGNGTTNLCLELMIDGDAKSLAALDRLKLVISGTSETGGELRPDQYMQLTNIALELPEGIKVDDAF